MNKIRVIDLLNKIANNEEIPKKIKWENIIYAYSEYDKDYLEYPFRDEEYRGLFDMRDSILTQFLNDEVEIIEEPKKIEKIKSNGDEFYSDYIDAWISKNKTDAYCEFLMNKINELIDKINNLKEK